MIDLNMKRKQQDDEPIGMIIISLIPFCALFWMLIEWGL